MYEVEIVQTQEKHITALVLHTTFENNRQAEEIPPFFHRTMDEGTLEQVPERVNGNQVCAIVKKPDSPEFDYYMGVETADHGNPPAGMAGLTIPGGRCATASFVKRGNADVVNAFGFITGQWLPQNGLQQDPGRPVFIYYDERFIPIYKAQGYEGNPVGQIFVPVR